MLLVAAGVAVAALGTVPASAATTSVIGHTRQGRPIVAIHAGTPTGPRILVVGCIHGNECAAAALIGPLSRTSLPIDLWIIPSLNPDGRRARTRQNAAGVDLNRNWAAGWQLRGRPWSTYYSGPAVFSEPESRVGRDFIATLKPRVTIWYHQQMNLVWASGNARAIGRVYARVVRMGMRTDDTIRGTATGWQRRVQPASAPFVVELPGGAMSATALRRHHAAIGAVGRAAAVG